MKMDLTIKKHNKTDDGGVSDTSWVRPQRSAAAARRHSTSPPTLPRARRCTGTAHSPSSNACVGLEWPC